MSEATVEVPHEDIPKFQQWLAWQCEEVGHGIQKDTPEAALEKLESAEAKVRKVRELVEQGNKAVAGEVTVYRGDPEVLLDACQGMIGEYAHAIKAVDEGRHPWDFDAAAAAIEPTGRWVKQAQALAKKCPDSELVA